MISANKPSGGWVTLKDNVLSTDNGSLTLTPREAILIGALMDTKGNPESIETLKGLIGYRPETETTAVQAAICRIRLKLKPIEEDLIVTGKGGYALAIE